MQGTIESKVFSRRASICVHFWMTSDQITRSVPNRDTRPFVFFVDSRILCRTRSLCLNCSQYNLLSMCNLFYRIGARTHFVFVAVARPLSILVRPWCVMLLTHHVNSIFVRLCVTMRCQLRLATSRDMRYPLIAAWRILAFARSRPLLDLYYNRFIVYLCYLS